MPKTNAELRDRKLYPVHGSGETVNVTLPAECDDEDGAAAEAEHYLETLRENRKIADEGAPLQPGQTHRIETDEEGRKHLKRKRFSAF